MHVVLKRRGITLRASWDGVAKPVTKQSSHWVRFTPSKTVVNEDFVTGSTATLFGDGIYYTKQSIAAESANLRTYNMRSPMEGMYDLSGEDLALSASMTRTTYGNSFITGLLRTAVQANTNLVRPSRPLDRTLVFDKDYAADARSSLATINFKPVVSALNRGVALANKSSVAVSKYQYDRLRLDYNWAQSNDSSVQTSNEYVDDVYVLKATLPDHALLEDDDPRLYDTLPPTNEYHMAIELNSDNTVVDFITASRTQPTLYCTGRQLNSGDGQSNRIGNPIIRVRPNEDKLFFTSSDHDQVLLLQRLT